MACLTIVRPRPARQVRPWERYVYSSRSSFARRVPRPGIRVYRSFADLRACRACGSTSWRLGRLRACESSGNYGAIDGSGQHFGAYQFDQDTWDSVGGHGRPDLQPPAEQDYRALYLYRFRGWQAWQCADASHLNLQNDFSAGSRIVPSYADSAYISGRGPNCPAVVGAIGDKYYALGGCGSFLGYPISPELGAQGGRFTRFQGGDIYWSPATGANVVRGLIEAQWYAFGAERGPFGFPTADEFDFFFGRLSLFQNGFIYWNPAVGTIPFHY